MTSSLFRASRLFVVGLLLTAMASTPAAESTGAELLDLDAHQGQVVVLDFWASWCVPCRRSFPWLNSMQAKYKDRGLVVIGVNLDNDREAADRFLKDYPAEFEVVFDPDGTLAREYEVIAMPSSLVFGRSGEIRNHHNGFRVRQQDEYEAAIVAALDAT